MFCYNGRILRVDLSTGSVRSENFDGNFAKKFIGGNGFAAKIFYDSIPLKIDPLSEENAVIFSTGPLNGTGIWGTGRGHAVTISPLTNYFADSNFGGDFASALKNTGYDLVMIFGKAEAPVYISISENDVSIKKCPDIWGKTTEESINAIKSKEGRDSQCAVIGPAGENGVLFANIICSGKRLSAAGRCGLGAVLGSKNCKGISVKGSAKITVSDPEKIKDMLKERYSLLRGNSENLTRLGTPSLIKILNDLGKLPSYNCNFETFDQSDKISGELIRGKYFLKNTACKNCPVACGKIISIPHGNFEGSKSKMPEYETLYSLGTMLNNSDIVSIFNANTMCDRMGIDTISMGVTLSFVAECIEKGKIKNNTESIAFGKCGDLAEFIKKTAMREGLGDMLSIGSERIAKELGNNCGDYLYSVKGLEIAGHSARGLNHMGLAYATSTRGGSHHDARPRYNDPEMGSGFEKVPQYCISSQNYTAVGDSLVMCRFIMSRGFGTEINESLCRLINYATGFDLDMEELNMIGERIYNLERMINVKRGLTRKMDTLPRRIFNEPIPEGPSKGMYCPEEEFNNMLSKYYRLRGWDQKGIPTAEKIKELQLD